MNVSPPARRILIWAFRLLLLAAVIVGVGHTFQSALTRLQSYDWQLRPDWLAASGALYILGLLPMAWLWKRLLSALGQNVPWPDLLNAHFLGHLGKYVPGKALVLVLRVGAIRRWVRSTWSAVLSIVLETLLMMAVGTFLAATMSALTLPLERGMIALAIAAAVGAFSPTLPPVVRTVASAGLLRFRFLRKQEGDEPDGSEHSKHADHVQELVSTITWRLWAEGWAASLLCWMFFGLSLWAVLRAIGVDSVSAIGDLPHMVAAVSLAVVAGFLSFLPGGLVVRDFLLLQLLTPTCGEANALIAAVLLRLVWLVSEILVCGIMVIGMYRRRFR
jgi:glycosyltransferase 2 family protein